MLLQNMRSDATTLKLGDHLKEDEEQQEEEEHESPAIPPLHRGQSREWLSQDLPLTPPKSKLAPPASWLADDDGVSLQVRSSSDGSASPEPLQPGVGAEAFLRANGVDPSNVGHAAASTKETQDQEPPQDDNSTDMADDKHERNQEHDQDDENQEMKQDEGITQQTQH